MTKNTTNTFNIPWIGHFLHFFHFGSVYFNTSFRNFMPKNNTFINHKVELIPIKNKISFFTSLQNFIKIVQTIIKGSSIDGKIVHEYLNNFFTKTMENSRHASLKCSRSIAHTKRHTSISISSIRETKSCFLLILCFHSDLRKPRITIKETKMSPFRQPI